MMQGNTTGIDIDDGYLTAVQTGGGLKGRRILSCLRIPLAENGLEGALDTLIRSMDLKNQALRVTLPDDLVSFRNVTMPFADMKKIRQALPFEVEGMLPYPMEELLIDFVATGDRSSGGILAAAVRRQGLSEYITTLQAHGIDPEVLGVRGASLASWLLQLPETPDHILVLDAGKRRHTLIVCLNRRIALIRSFSLPSATDTAQDAETFLRSLCRSVLQTVHAFCVGQGTGDRPERLFFTGESLGGRQSADLLGRYLGMPVQPIDVSRDTGVRMEGAATAGWSAGPMNGAAALALMDPGKGEGFNFRRDGFAKGSHYLQIRKVAPKAAILLFLILSFLTADGIIDYYSLKHEYRMLDREVTAIFRQALPGMTRIVDPVQQLRVSVEEMKRSLGANPGGKPEGTLLDLLKEISGRIPADVHLQVRHMGVDPDTVRLSGQTDAFNDVDRIKNELAASKALGPVAITSANLDSTGKTVRFEISVERKR